MRLTAPRTLVMGALLVTGLLVGGPARSSPALPADGPGFVLSGGWPLSVSTTATFGDRLFAPFVGGRWDIGTDLLRAQTGVAVSPLDLGWLRLRGVVGAAGLVGVGKSVDLGAQGFGEAQAVLSWRFLRAYAGPRVDVASALSRVPEGRLSLLATCGGGLVVGGVGMWARAQGGYAFSGLVRGGFTAEAELAVSVPVTWPGGL